MTNLSRQAVIVDGVRTPFGRAHPEKGWLRNVRADELVSDCLHQLVVRNYLDMELVDDVIVGCALQTGETSLNIARQAALLTGLPDTCPAVTVNRLCGSSLQALHYAVHAIEAGQADVQLVAGVEKMTGQPPPPADLFHPRMGMGVPPAAISMGMTAEFLAYRYGISRAEQDVFALRSHQLAAAEFVADRQAIGYLAPEIVCSGKISSDQTIRPETNLEALAQLPPAFMRDGSVTAGNSSPRSDGAAALLVMSRERALALDLPIRAVVRATAVAGVSPSEMGLGPIPAIEKLLARAKLQPSDIGSIELNEAFAAQALACIRQGRLDPDKVNRRGGAIAIGHPLGASGCRLILSLVHTLHSDATEFGIAAMCIGMGQGIATLLHRVD